MAREFAEWFYNSKAWKRCRYAYISQRRAIDGGICEKCHERPGLIVHHRVHLTPANIHDPDVSLNENNLMYVCHQCHDIIHGYTHQLPEGSMLYSFDERGNPVPTGTAQAPLI